MTKAQKEALAVLGEGWMTETSRVVHGISRSTLTSLIKKGLVRFVASRKPQNWKLTKYGEQVCASL